jgi:hypothetical protein
MKVSIASNSFHANGLFLSGLPCGAESDTFGVYYNASQLHCVTQTQSYEYMVTLDSQSPKRHSCVYAGCDRHPI